MVHGSEPLHGRRLRIVHVAACPFPSSQGTQVYIRGLARALARRGHDVTVVCYGHGEGPLDSEYRVVRTPSIPGYRRMRSGPDVVKPLLDVALAAQVARVDADVVHAHNIEGPMAAALAGMLRHRPVLFNAHTSLKEELPTYFQSRPFQWLGARLGAVIDHSLPRLADASMAIREQHAQVLHQRGVPRVFWVPPGVDAEDLVETEPWPLPPGPWVVYAGNPDAYQDLQVLFAAMEQLPDVGLLLVGASPFPQTPTITRRHVVQTTDFSVVRRCLAAADVAALPRGVCSGFPIKLLNYLGMGLATVAATGAAALLPGMVQVENDNPTAMAQAIRALISQPRQCHNLGQAGRQHVLSSCLWTHRIVDVEEIYAELMGIGRRRGILRWTETTIR